MEQVGYSMLQGVLSRQLCKALRVDALKGVRQLRFSPGYHYSRMFADNIRKPVGRHIVPLAMSTIVRQAVSLPYIDMHIPLKRLV